MRRLLLIIGLAVAATSVASADPDRGPYDRSHDRRADDYNDRSWFTRDMYRDRWDRNRYDRGNWVPLARANSASTDRQFVNLRGRGGRFNRIRVESVRGAPVIHKVAIEYVGDPNTQVVEMNTRLPRGSGETIRLNGHRAINRIIVYTEPSYRGSYSIFGA